MRRPIALLLLALLLAGCGSGPTTGPARPPATTAERAGAPPITAPRELSSRATDPCRTLLTPAQVRLLRYAPSGEFKVDVLGAPTCDWREEVSGRSVDVSVVLGRDLFVDTYRNRFLPVFRPVDIGGLPAVDIMSDADAVACTTTVGVADGQSLELDTYVGVGLDGVRDGDPCEEGHQVAEAIVSALPPR